jgi:PAS domain S-box-containing protein
LADPTLSNEPASLSYEQAEAILQRLGGVRSAPAPDPFAAPRPPASPTARPAAPVEPIAPLTADALRGLVDAVPDALVVVDGSGRIVLVNRQTEQLFGYTRGELLGLPIETLLPERFREQHVSQRNGYFEKPHVRPMGKGLELVGRRKDGHEVPVEISLSPLHTDAGVLAVSSIRDVSERRRAEGQLRKMEARYRTLVEGIPAVTFMAAMDDSGERELYVSPQIEELLGFSQKEWLENPILWYTQLHAEDRARWHKEFAHTCSTGERFRSVYRFVARSGRVVWVHGEAQMVKDDDGQPLFLQGVAFDVTGIKEAEEGLKALNATLEERVAERTAESEERAKELARSNDALGQFGYIVAHDLRQPLRTMKSYIQKLAEKYREQVDEQGRDYITRAVNAADRMSTLINDLLTYSRVRTQGKNPAPVDCADALRSASENLQAAIEECGATVRAADLPIVLADRTQLIQLFQNLIGNSLKYRSEVRDAVVQVSARRGGGGWVIEVADNGIGIEAEYLKRIFGLGERLHTAARIPGNGIGLATCEQIVQRHDGRIWAASDGPDRGATISFTMPAAEE